MTDQQIKSVVRWMLEANHETDIREAIAVTFNKADKKEQDALLEAAVEEIFKVGEQSEDYIRGWCIAASQEIVRRLIEIGDYKAALQGIRQVQTLSDK